MKNKMSGASERDDKRPKEPRGGDQKIDEDLLYAIQS